MEAPAGRCALNAEDRLAEPQARAGSAFGCGPDEASVPRPSSPLMAERSSGPFSRYPAGLFAFGRVRVGRARRICRSRNRPAQDV